MSPPRRVLVLEPFAETLAQHDKNNTLFAPQRSKDNRIINDALYHIRPIVTK